MLNSVKDMRKDIKRISTEDETGDTSDDIQGLTIRVENLEERVTRVDRTVCDAMMRVEGAMTVMANKLLAIVSDGLEIPQLRIDVEKILAAFQVGINIGKTLDSTLGTEEQISGYRGLIPDRNFNTIARAQNARLRIEDNKAQLSPLHNVETNQEIAYFPTTPKALSKMSHNLLHGLLQELGSPMPGHSRRTMRDRVRVVIGLNYPIDGNTTLRSEENDEGNGFDGFNTAYEFQNGWDDDFGMNDFAANRFASDQFDL
ncbi:hypothetical protein E6O75_ATG11490 [Venturia nashicola]|uniref:Uncharacterized protein n=1 Tax=Venturia nashicola TaxID=86259 RepID=A0A4Z1NSW3_9PEZI|nr:hypothetical protein E6O75_ATG11490 [Venturia nashicola]